MNPLVVGSSPTGPTNFPDAVMPIQTWMIYGAYGYSAQLLGELAKDRGLTPALLMGKDFASSLPGSSEIRVY